MVEEKVDNSSSYRRTDFPMRDKVFNWLVRKYEAKGRKWGKSDDVIFGGAIYVIWDWCGILLFLYVMWLLFNFSRKHYDDVHAIAFLMVMILWRLNILIRKVGKLSG